MFKPRLPKQLTVRSAAVLALAAALFSVPAQATTLIRASVADLVKANETVMVGEVVDVHSYWNADSSFILTDVTIRPEQVLKGAVRKGGVVTLTQMGGTVGDLTTLILGGPELTIGQSYVLFVNRENLPGAERVTTIRDHCQGVFDIQTTADGEVRAISQANHLTLAPNAKGVSDVPGGLEGFTLHQLTEKVFAAHRLQNETEEK